MRQADENVSRFPCAFGIQYPGVMRDDEVGVSDGVIQLSEKNDPAPPRD